MMSAAEYATQRKFRVGTRLPTIKDGQPEIVVRGFVGADKGMKQILFERGFGTVYANKQATEDILKESSDFTGELNAFEQLVADSGNLVERSPKFHAEIAGNGVEYSFGQCKKTYRAENDCNPRTLHERVKRSVLSVSLRTSQRCAARTRRIRAGYLGTEGAVAKEDIDRFARRSRTHRSMLDQATWFIAEEMRRGAGGSTSDGAGPAADPITVPVPAATRSWEPHVVVAMDTTPEQDRGDGEMCETSEMVV